MNESHWLTRRFDDHRAHLRGVAYRMLGSASDADDAVQEAWLKVSRSDPREIENLGGWLTTVVARVCLDALRARRSRPEEARASLPEPHGDSTAETGLALTDALGPALRVVMERLAPAERVAFVLHDLFELTFEEIAPIVERTPAATRQLASRARRRLGGAPAPAEDAEHSREVVDAFLSASRDGDLQRLVMLLSPEVVLRADELAVRTSAAYQQRGAPKLASEVRGASSVADAFKGRAGGALPALIDGEPGAIWAVGGTVRSVFVFTIEGGTITGIDLLMEPKHLAELEVTRG